MEKDIQDILATLPSVEEVARMPRNEFVEVYEALLSFVQLLIGTMEEMQEEIHKLQRRLNTNSSNSGIPSSRNPIGYEESQNSKNASEDTEAKDEKDGKDGGEGPTGTSQSSDEADSSTKSNKRVGGKPGHKGHRQRFVKPDEEIDCFPERCTCGCEDFHDLGTCYTHQYVEIPHIPAKVSHFLCHKVKCAKCGKELKGKVPAEFSTGYGPGVVSLAAYLFVLGVSRRGIEQFLTESSIVHTSHGEGIPISQGGIDLIFDRVSASMKEHYDKIGEIAKTAPVNHVDETSWRLFGPIEKAKVWLWVMVSTIVCYFRMDDHRDRNAFEALIGSWSGNIITDDYALYRSWPAEKRQNCLAHICREAKKQAQDPSPDIAKGGQLLYDELCRFTQIDIETLTEPAWRAYQMRLKGLINRFMNREDGLGRLASRLKKSWTSLCTFLRVPEVERTNNNAERALRTPVVARKKALGSTSRKGLNLIERVMSVLMTCKLQGWSVYEVLRECITNHLKKIPQDLSRYEQPMQTALELRKKMGLDQTAIAEAQA